MTAWSRFSVVDTTDRRRLRCVVPGESPTCLAVQRELELIDLGPSWPLREPITVILDVQGEHDERAGCVRLALITQVLDRTLGTPIEIRFVGRLYAHHEVAGQFLAFLESFIIHEVREAVRLDGKLVRDPHARENRYG